jgi:hypothetical protein
MGMEKYMGIQKETRMARDLPCLDIEGTLFQIDIEKREFRQLDDAYNRMPFGDIKEEFGFSVLRFDTKTKNLYPGSDHKSDDVPGHVRLVILPSLKELDPVGLARLHGFPDHYYSDQQKDNKPKTLTVFSKGNPNIERPRKRGLTI